MAISIEDSIVGCLLGTAVGDAMGLPSEGLSRRRLARYYPQITGHHFFFGQGMISDDTEHTCMVAQALVVSGGEIEPFRKDLARRLRYWLLGIPASVGFATARAGLKLWLGFSPEQSGVFSAGNGPAMRSAILGAAYRNAPAKLRKLVRASTRITHRDPKAEYGAQAVALAAQAAALASPATVEPGEFQRQLQELFRGEPAEEFLDLIKKAVESVERKEETGIFAESLGLGNGVSGYVYHTVPVALHAWMSNQKDFAKAVPDTIRCGGDTDTAAAIVGGIVGAGVGPQGVPENWIETLWEWPRTVDWMQALGFTIIPDGGKKSRRKVIH